jgi:hypothetical protein
LYPYYGFVYSNDLERGFDGYRVPKAVREDGRKVFDAQPQL